MREREKGKGGVKMIERLSRLIIIIKRERVIQGGEGRGTTEQANNKAKSKG